MLVLLKKNCNKTDIFFLGNHYTEQYKYLDNSVKIHIIKFENLIPELKKLYVMYNLEIDLINKIKLKE